jgi:hypothetical protein
MGEYLSQPNKNKQTQSGHNNFVKNKIKKQKNLIFK